MKIQHTMNTSTQIRYTMYTFLKYMYTKDIMIYGTAIPSWYCKLLKPQNSKYHTYNKLFHLLY